MKTDLIECERIAQRLLDDARIELTELRLADLSTGLATVVVGDDETAVADQRRLTQLASSLGVDCEPVRSAGTASEHEVVESVRALGEEREIAGVVVLGQLPRQIDERAVHAAIPPAKDIDAVHPENLGLLAIGSPRYVPSIPAAAFEVLDDWIAGAGQDAADLYRRCRIVVVGGMTRIATSSLLLGCARRAPVAVVDPVAIGRDRLGWYTRHADVLIVCAGAPRLIRAEHVPRGAIVIDACDARGPGSVGDVDVDDVLGRARAVTPAHGAIGAVRDALLMRGLARAAWLTAQRPLRAVRELP